MGKQKEQILISVSYIKKLFPAKFSPRLAIITEKYFGFGKNFKILGSIEFKKIPPLTELMKTINPGKIIFARYGNKDVIIYSGRLRFFDGFSMREI